MKSQAASSDPFVLDAGCSEAGGATYPRTVFGHGDSVSNLAEGESG